MTLGEKISELRNSKNMSQSDLAEKLDVSRQSVSKWETNASIPELDKLIQLSDLFEITLDELVLHKKQEDNKENDSILTESSPTIIVNKNLNYILIIGIILLTLGMVCFILGLFFGKKLIFLGTVFISSSLLFFPTNKKLDLFIGWSIFLELSFTFIVGSKGTEIYNGILYVLAYFCIWVYYTYLLLYKKIKN